MYFLGECYFNGYGVTADKEKAREWFTKAYAAGEKQAGYELAENVQPGNAYVNNPGLKKQVEQLENHTKNFSQADVGFMTGHYSGYAIYYDYSKQYVQEIVPVELNIKKTNDLCEGSWIEDGNDTACLKSHYENGAFYFDTSAHYSRHRKSNLYYPEKCLLKTALLDFKRNGDSLYLSGNLQVYSQDRREPSEPVYISVSRSSSASATDIVHPDLVNNLTISPNPARTQIHISFTLARATDIQVQLISMSGALLQQQKPETLSSGRHTIAMSLQGLAAGAYIVRLIGSNQSQSQIFIKE